MQLLISMPMVVMVALLPLVTVADPGTTPNLESIFLGRCNEFQQMIRPDLFKNGQKDCSQLWGLFKKAFANKPHCNASVDDFKEFADAIAHPIPTGTAVYYYGMWPFVYKYSDRGYRATAMDGYMAGHIGQDITFCGSETDPSGMDPNSCPDYKSCDGHALVNFWAAVSHRFSMDTEGDVTVFLNGSRGPKPTFKPTSIFGSQELKNLVPPRVNKLTAWVVHTVGAQKTESCGEGSLLDLKTIAEGQGLAFECIDDPPETLLLQCVSSISAPECHELLMEKPASSSSQGLTGYYPALLVTMATALFFKQI